MEKRRAWKWIVAGFAIFAVSRLFVIFGYERYWTDVALYHEAAFYGVKAGYRAYRDFWFPYPPMSLPLIYAPMLVVTEITAYRRVFQYEMFLFDLGTLIYLLLFLKNRFSISDKLIASAAAIYAGFGMLVGHLIYDRLDIVIAFVFMASLYHFTSTKRMRLEKGMAYAFAFLGAMMKLLPLLWAPIFVIVEFFRITNVAQASRLTPNDCRFGKIIHWIFNFSHDDRNTSVKNGAIPNGRSEHRTSNIERSILNGGGEGRGRFSALNFARALLPIIAVFVLFVLAIFAYDATTNNPKTGKGLLSIMGEHGDRGIQMESNWAVPMMCANLLRELSGQSISFHIETVYGAQHFKKSELNYAYVVAAKYAGFAALVFIYGAIISMAFFRADFRKRLSTPEWTLAAMLGVLMFVITTQRVLSPQYLLWVMPGLVAAVFPCGRISMSRLFLFFYIFALTYVEFDIGYERLTRMDSMFVCVLVVRNILLIIGACLVLGDVFLIKNISNSSDPLKIA